jgi:tetratricopeptide (TPR) repeat protein
MYEEINQNDNKQTYYLENFALALSDLGSIKEDKSLIKKSFIYYEQYLAHQKNDIQVLENYISALFDCYHLEPNEELLNQSFKLIQAVLTNKPNDTYNLACYYSIKNNLELSKENLLLTEKYDTLPSDAYRHLQEDRDLNNIRHEQWFMDLIERLKEKEIKDKVA